MLKSKINEKGNHNDYFACYFIDNSTRSSKFKYITNSRQSLTA